MKIKQVLRYTAIFEPDLAVGGYTVTVPALPGCITEGDSLQEAQHNAKEAILAYLESLESHHEPLPKETHSPLTRTMTITLSKPPAGV